MVVSACRAEYQASLINNSRLFDVKSYVGYTRIVVLSPDITGGPCRGFTYRLAQVEIHWGETDKAGSEHLIDGRAYAAEVR